MPIGVQQNEELVTVGHLRARAKITSHSAGGTITFHLRGSPALQGAEDSLVAESCREIDCCLIIEDLDFSQIMEFPPENYPGSRLLTSAISI
jgi:hypothetical protein